MIDKSHCWKKTALAAATALLCLWSSNAAALSLGRITIQSALGEPLRAEVDIPEINAEEAASLKASVALPEAFRAAGLEYNPAMSGLQATLQRRVDGRAYIRITGDRAINDPFVDMILEARWASGRIVRDYTMLFDPPKVKPTTANGPTPAQLPLQAQAARPPAPVPIARPAPTIIQPEPRKPAASPAPAEPTRDSGRTAVPVRAGDTAGKIAANVKPANVSLDQMLVAMLRANPNAFIGDNINRVKAGSVINIPTAEQAATTEAGEATRIIVAQSKDFNDFRRKLAGSAPEAPVAAADRQVSGTVQAKVDDKKPTGTAPDKLTLTKGAIPGKAAEEQLVSERNAKEAASRAAEIARNISELSQLSAASSAVAPMAPASQTTATQPAPPPLPAASTAVAVTAALPASAPAVVSAASAPKPVASAPQPPAPLPEATLLDGLIEDPLVPAGAVGLIALLAGLGIYRVRQRKKAAHLDSAFQESRSRPDSFFGTSGGQSVDTNESAAAGSSMMYSASQLDAVDDVDPVAEADVYLAYGRDIQAEEILKDALITNPGRLAIHHKLLEIYAKRRDTQAFENIARQAFKAANGDATEWDRICELGLSIDPANALYKPGGEPGQTEASASRPSAVPDQELSEQNTAPVAEVEPMIPAGGAIDLDLDLDFSLDDEPASAIKSTIASGGAVPETAATEAEPDELDLDFGMKTQVFERPEIAPNEASSNAIEFTLPDLDINESSLDAETFKQQAAKSFGSTGPAPVDAQALPDKEDASSNLGMLEFDLESLSLDLGDSSGPITEAEPTNDLHEDPLVTKLALAEEFRAIGDDDGARALIDEVIAEATGDMKIKAQRALSNL